MDQSTTTNPNGAQYDGLALQARFDDITEFRGAINFLSEVIESELGHLSTVGKVKVGEIALGWAWAWDRVSRLPSR